MIDSRWLVGGALLLVFTTACNGTHEGKDKRTSETGSAPTAGRAKSGWNPIKVTTDANLPIAIEAYVSEMGGKTPVTAMPTIIALLQYKVTATRALPGQVDVSTRLGCRIDDVNYHFDGRLSLDDVELTGKQTELSRVLQIDGNASACQISFVYFVKQHTGDLVKDELRYSDPAANPIAGTLCMQPTGLSDGPCPAGTFRAPTLPAGMTISTIPFQHGWRGGHTLEVEAVTFSDSPRHGLVYDATVHCDGGSHGQAELGISNLYAIPPGFTLSYPISIAVEPDLPDEPVRCQVDFTSAPSRDENARHIALGSSCLSKMTRWTPGACNPPLEPARPGGP